jgi:hypothetical protein
MVSQVILELHLHLAGEPSIDDWDLIDRTATEKVSYVAEDSKSRHCKEFQCLHKAQHLPILPDSRETVVNLSKMLLEEETCLALSKGLTNAETLAVVPVEDILCGVEIAQGALPMEPPKEVRQENVRIIKGFCKPKDNLTSEERRTLWALKANVKLMVFLADKGNVTVVLDTTDYNQKIAALLEDQTYRKLKKDPTESVEHKTFLLLKKSPISEMVCLQLWLQHLRPLRLYGLPKIYKQVVTLRPMVSTSGAPITTWRNIW